MERSEIRGCVAIPGIRFALSGLWLLPRLDVSATCAANALP
jgi:hypothetical protein